MFAARADQENFVHGQQTIAASKPLNQGVRGFTAKTPGNKAPKTPFKVPLNDENAAGQTGKNALKTNGKAFTLGKKDAFVTPGPVNRKALGAKTTNAKTQVFLTPAQKKVDASPTKTQQKQKSGSPRLHRPKVKVLQAETVIEHEDYDDVDIEFMPPRSQPLKGYPSEDEFGPNKTFPHLQPENLMRGWAEVYMNPVDGHGVYQSDRLRAERDAKVQKIQEARMQKCLDDTFDSIEQELLGDLGLPTKPKHSAKVPGTLRSKDAASALSNAQSRRVGPSAASKPRPAALNVRKTRQPAPSSSSARFANSSAASKSTLGYAQGRAISQKVRKPITSVFRDETSSKVPGRSASAASTQPSVTDEDFDKRAGEVVAAMRQQNLSADAGEDDIDADLFSPSIRLDGDEDDVFQLPMPETD